MYQSIEPWKKKTPLGKNPYPLKLLDAHSIALDQVAISRSRENGFVWTRADCIREAINEYLQKNQC